MSPSYVAAYVALGSGIVVTIAYLAVIYRGFGRSKAEMAAYGERSSERCSLSMITSSTNRKSASSGRRRRD